MSAPARVRPGQKFIYRPNPLDLLNPQFSGKDGDRVEIIQLYGAPKPGTMGQTHVALVDNPDIVGMVSLNSLEEKPKQTKRSSKSVVE